jgi:hypothetical protein
VKYHDTSVNFPDTKVQPGRDLGPAIDIGPATSQTILKSNGEITYKTDVRSLTPAELALTDEAQLHCGNDEAIIDKLGASISPDYYKDDRESADLDMPSHDAYEDDQVPYQTMPNADDVELDVDLMTNMSAPSYAAQLGTKSELEG